MTALNENKEFRFGRKEFDQIRKILYQKAGIRLAESKDSMVYSRLARRLRALKLRTFAEYLQYLDTHSEEEPFFIEALTTNLTSFFREKHHFPILSDYLQKKAGPVKIWCAASSTGEEPYSIAMTVAEVYDSFNPPVSIIASDIDTNVLQKAKAGIYSIDKVKNLTHAQKKKFFYKGVGSNDGKVRVVPELAKMVDFRKINLMDKKWSVQGPLDIIFCRNVMIYFDKKTQEDILSRMTAIMPSSGLYFAGHSETFSGAEHIVKGIGKTVYQPIRGLR